jgi:protein-tyrosine phosphatase
LLKLRLAKSQLLVLLYSIFFPLLVTAELPVQQDFVLVIDKQDENSWPRNYRSVKLLQASASGQFSEPGLKKILSTAGKQLIVVDLRQESHGFVNGVPATWYGFRNQLNQNLSVEQILQKEQKLLADLSTKPMVTLHQGIKDQGNIQSVKAIKVSPKTVESESKLTGRLGAGYKRFFVLDHHKPEDPQVDLFVTFIKNLPKDTWLHFHCRGGRGRSSTFITLYDIIKNAQVNTLQEILLRQEQAGSINLSNQHNANGKKWKRNIGIERYRFIEDFYAYAKDLNGFATKSWGQWLNSRTEFLS